MLPPPNAACVGSQGHPRHKLLKAIFKIGVIQSTCLASFYIDFSFLSFKIGFYVVQVGLEVQPERYPRLVLNSYPPVAIFRVAGCPSSHCAEFLSVEL